MRNMRGALWALGLAGASYAWRNRSRLQQQFNQYNSNRRGTPQQLPDYNNDYNQRPSEEGSSWDQPRERQFGGADV